MNYEKYLHSHKFHFQIDKFPSQNIILRFLKISLGVTPSILFCQQYHFFDSQSWILKKVEQKLGFLLSKTNAIASPIVQYLKFLFSQGGISAICESFPNPNPIP